MSQQKYWGKRFSFEFYNPVRIIMGRKKAKSYISGLQGKVLVVTGGERSKRIAEVITGKEYPVVSGIKPNPSFSDVVKVYEGIERHDPDVVVAIGGGSVIDATKAGLFLESLDDKSEEAFFEYSLTGKKWRSVRAEGKMVAVNTLPGTGSEVSPAFLVVKGNTKEIFVGVFPEVAILDPTVQIAPYDVAVSAALDSLVQGIESLVSKRASPLSTLYGERAVKYAWKGLVNLRINERSIHAREQISMAGVLSIYAIALAGVGWAHAISHPLSALYGLSHGLSAALVLPYVLDIYGKEICWKVGTVLETEDVVSTLFDFLKLLGVRRPLPIKKEDYERIIEGSKNPDILAAPVELSDRDIAEILDRLREGKPIRELE